MTQAKEPPDATLNPVHVSVTDFLLELLSDHM